VGFNFSPQAEARVRRPMTIFFDRCAVIYELALELSRLMVESGACEPPDVVDNEMVHVAQQLVAK
jgi:spore coat protein CotF